MGTPLTIGSLFSGIGGVELGLEATGGFETRWQCESHPYCLQVLSKHWPEATIYGNVHEVEWERVEKVDVVTAGFPCQPVSVAGRKEAQNDERWLWPEVTRCIRVVRPPIVLLENVPGLLVRGMGDVLGELSALGYDAEWETLSAQAFGAPHLRYRVFLVAYLRGTSGRISYSECDGLRIVGECRREQHDLGGEAQPGAVSPDSMEELSYAEIFGREGAWSTAEQAQSTSDQRHQEGASVADSNSRGREVVRVEESGGLEGQRRSEPDGRSEVRQQSDTAPVCDSQIFPKWTGLREAEPDGVWRGRLGDTDWWEFEPDVGRVANGIPSRVDRLRALGNAVVPQITQWIGERILECVMEPCSRRDGGPVNQQIE